MCGCGSQSRTGLSPSDAAVMCLVCPPTAARRRGEACRAEPGRLVSVSVRASEGSCPRGHHDVAPRWMGVRWAGVPRPVRWALSVPLVRMAMGLEADPPADSAAAAWRRGERGGCGCVVELKEGWQAISSSAWARRAACAAAVAIAAVIAAR